MIRVTGRRSARIFRPVRKFWISRYYEMYLYTTDSFISKQPINQLNHNLLTKMVFSKGENSGGKRKSVSITPSKSNNNNAVLYGKCEMILSLYFSERNEEHFSDYDVTKFLENKIKEMDIPEESVASLLEELNERASDLKEEAMRLKVCVIEAGKDIVVDQNQDQILQSIERMTVDELDSFWKFLDLAFAKVNFTRHTSQDNHPEHKRNELMMESLSSVLNTKAEDAFTCSINYRTKLRVPATIRASSSSSASASASTSAWASTSASPPPNMEDITQAGTGEDRSTWSKR